MPEKPNHAHDRIYGGGGQPFELGYQPDADDYRRWLLTEAERIFRSDD